MFLPKQNLLNVTKKQLFSTPPTKTHFRSVMSTASPDGITPETNPIQFSIHNKVQSTFNPTHFQIHNDSYKHAHHAGLRGASNTTESHFRLVIVSDDFKGKGLPIRHRMVYKLLDEEIKEHGVHAIQLKTKTIEEWEKEIAKNGK